MNTKREFSVNKDHKCPVCGKEIDLKKRLGKIEKGFKTTFCGCEQNALSPNKAKPLGFPLGAVLSLRAIAISVP